MTQLVLTRGPLIKTALRSRLPQVLVTAILLALFLFTIVAGMLGTPVGSVNFSIVFVWIAWWAVLILLAVPFFGRGWCAVCPIPAPGEWLQRGSVLSPTSDRAKGPRAKWPRFLRNIWIQSGLFLLMAVFSTVLLTSPLVTALVLASMLAVALGVGIVFERRTFCRYLCPVSGFIGLYSQTAPVELRVKDRAICAECESKPCYNGSSAGYGCPWGVFPGGLSRNTNCGLCLECLRTCPSDNIAVNVRGFGHDLRHPVARLDESAKSFIMLGSSMAYSAVLLGPWASLKDAAYHIGSSSWFAYAAALVVFVCVALPAAFAPCALGDGGVTGFRQRFARLSSALIPLGLMAWIAFSLSFVLTNATYIPGSLSDPLGLGWNLLRIGHIAWRPLFSSLLAPAQTLALAIGFLWSARIARRNAGQLHRSSLPVTAYCFAATLALLWLLV